MVKRLAAFLFILVIAGQVSAGVCGCVGGKGRSVHSCCKRGKVAGDTIRNKGCCEAECIGRQSDRPVQDRTAPQAKLQVETADTPLQVRKFTLERTVLHRTVSVNHFANHRLKYARPPELYLRHRAILI